MTAKQGGKVGMRREDGQYTEGQLAHIHQSLTDIFTTPIGSRIQRRDYGSHLFALIDSPMNAAGRLRLAAAIIDAAYRWEPRVVITYAHIHLQDDGRLRLEYHARTLAGEELKQSLFLR